MKKALTSKQKKLLGSGIIALVVILFVVIFIYVGKPMLEFVQEPERFQAWVNQRGALSRLAFIGMMLLQIVVGVIPGEPLEIGAGYAFGFWEGTLLCMIAIFIASVCLFLLVRKYGTRLISLFLPIEKLQSVRFLQDSKRLNLLTFIIFLIPGTPKDLLTYFVGLTNMSLPVWMFIASVARIPSVVTSTLGGAALGEKNYTIAIIVFAVTLVISGAGLLYYRHLSKKDESIFPSVSHAEVK